MHCKPLFFNTDEAPVTPRRQTQVSSERFSLYQRTSAARAQVILRTKGELSLGGWVSGRWKGRTRCTTYCYMDLRVQGRVRLLSNEMQRFENKSKTLLSAHFDAFFFRPSPTFMQPEEPATLSTPSLLNLPPPFPPRLSLHFIFISCEWLTRPLMHNVSKNTDFWIIGQLIDRKSVV